MVVVLAGIKENQWVGKGYSSLLVDGERSSQGVEKEGCQSV